MGRARGDPEKKKEANWRKLESTKNHPKKVIQGGGRKRPQREGGNEPRVCGHPKDTWEKWTLLTRTPKSGKWEKLPPTNDQ